MASSRVLITGATSGLGREIAIQLAREGCRVAVTGRREARLKEVEKTITSNGGECLPLLGSVTDQSEVKRHYARIKSEWNGLDWAILNAGIAESASALNFSAELYHRILATNVGGAVNWLEAVLPDMIAGGRGTIAGIASLAAWRGLPNSGPYCASKAALVALLESTRVELRGTGVSVVTICPGFIKSEITDRNDPAAMPFLLETEDGAGRIISAIKRKKSLAHFPWQLSLPYRHVVRPMPNFMYDWFISRFRKPLNKKPYRDESADGTRS